MSIFNDAIDATLSGWKTADGQPLTMGQKAALTDLLRIGGFEDFLGNNQATHRSWLAPGSATNKIPIFWSGRFTGTEEVEERVGKFKVTMNIGDTVAFDIGDTEWGKFLNNEDGIARARFAAAAEDIQNFARANLGGELTFDSGDGTGPKPITGNGVKNIAWNYGSADFADNAIANGTPGRLMLGDTVSPNSGLVRMEMPRLAAVGFELNGEAVSNDVGSMQETDRAFTKAEDGHRGMFRGVDGTLDSRRLWEFENDSRFGQMVTRIKVIITDLVAKGIDVTDKTLKQIERDFVRAYRAEKAKITQWADYSIERGKLTLAALDANADRLPAHIREAFEKSTQKFRDFISKPDGSLDRVRVGAGLATGVLSIANLWVEFARRDYDPDRIADYLKVAAKEAIESLPTVALMVGAAAMAGPVGWFALGAVGGYFAIRQVVSTLAESDVLDRDGVTYKIVKQIDDALDSFEKMVGGYLDQAKKALAEGTELGLEYVTGSAIEWTAEESAAWVGEGNDILVGDDLSLLIGSEENNWLIHRSAGEVYGEAGNDMLIGWLPEEIKEGQIVGVEAGAKSGQWTKNEADEWEWQEQPLGAVTARELREMEKAASEQHNRDVDSGLYSDDPADSHYKPKPKQIEGVIRAEQDHTLTLDAGEGNDWVITILGEKATTIGGLGRDWIYNTSAEGIIWGDIANSVERSDGSRVALVDGQVVEIADDASNSDNFWYSGGTTIMDAGKHDVLKFLGVTLTGGEVGSSAWSLFAGARSGSLMVAGTVNGLAATAAASVNAVRGRAGQSRIYYDTFLPFIAYTLQDNGNGGQDLVVTNLVTAGIGAAFFGQSGEASRMVVKDYDIAKVGGFTSGFDALGGARTGDLGMLFRDFNPAYAIAALAPLLQGVPIAQSLMAAYQVLTLGDAAAWTAAAALRLAKGAAWAAGGDPLVIDLDGDGIETIGLAETRAYFDVDGDFFRERTGWLKGDDGFLVLDANANGRIDDVSEMFGDRTQLGYAELAAYDTNADGKISVGDLMWSELKVWQDYDRDGETDVGELKSLSALGIRELSLGTTALNATTPQGTQLLSFGSVTFESGRVSTMFEAIFNSNDTDTKYAGEAGRAPWQLADTLNAKGFGTITDLAVATANDVGLAELAQSRAASMVTPNLRTLVAQSGDVLGTWGMTLETSRELIAVRLSPASAGASGGQLLEHRLWDGGALEAGWTLEQAWSPTTRSAAEMPARDEAPYLTQIINGRAVILDYGIKQLDGTWKLASDPATTYATREDIAALAHPAGTEWRVEDIQFNPLADLPVEQIGVNFINGEAVDYTVQVTDNDGSFYVWARNLDRALQLQAKTGAAYEFNLRNFQVDFETLDEVNSTDDSRFRVELLTPAQFHFATSLGGIDFRAEMLTATYNNVTGQLAYTVNGVRGAGAYVGKVDAAGNPVLVTYSDGTVEQAQEYQSDVKTMISLLQPVMEQYIVTSRRFAVRMALQGGLSEYARGLSYDAARDVYVPTTDRQMAPVFEAIFEVAPASNANDAVLDYLTDWNEILWQIYPDYAPTGSGNLLGAAVGIDQAFIMQMLIPAFEERYVFGCIGRVSTASNDNQAILLEQAA